jgi:hypothetical protein
MFSNCENAGGCSTVQIVQSAVKTFFTRLFYANTGEPFDLTGVTEIVGIFPGPNNSQVVKTYTDSGGITVVGAPGAGKIQFDLTTIDTQKMQALPQVNQNLQVIATISGVAQTDVLSLESPPVTNNIYSTTLNGILFSYMARLGDTAEDVFDALATQIVSADLPMTAVVSGSYDEAVLTLTSTIAALGFSDVVSSNVTLTPTVANGGTRTIFLLQQVLNIQPQSYTGE